MFGVQCTVTLRTQAHTCVFAPNGWATCSPSSPAWVHCNRPPFCPPSVLLSPKGNSLMSANSRMMVVLGQSNVFALTMTHSPRQEKERSHEGERDKSAQTVMEALMIWLSLQHLQFSGWTLAVGVWEPTGSLLVSVWVGSRIKTSYRLVIKVPPFAHPPLSSALLIGPLLGGRGGVVMLCLYICKLVLHHFFPLSCYQSEQHSCACKAFIYFFFHCRKTCTVA